MKVVVEPSSAVTLAAQLNKLELFEGRRVGLVLTGGNVDTDDLPVLITGASWLEPGLLNKTLSRTRC